MNHCRVNAGGRSTATAAARLATSSLVIGRRREVASIVPAGSLGGSDAGGSPTPATAAAMFRMISLVVGKRREYAEFFCVNRDC